MLEVRNITFSYGLKETLSDVTFDVSAGEILAVIGANGAGKTTLLRLLACLLMQNSGNIRFNDDDTLARPVRYRRRVGYLSEKCPLYNDMTVEGYLAYRLRLRGERSSRLQRRVDEVLGLCDLIDVRGTVTRALSHGYRKRVGLADALALRPGLLLLDDPLAGLDLPQRRQVATTLTAMSARSAVVLAGHEVAQMLEWCTHVLVLRKGRVAGQYRVGNHVREELLRQIEKDLSGEDVKEGEA